MATAPRIITRTEIDHVSVMVRAQDIKLLDHGNGTRTLVAGGLHIYVDTDGITQLLELLLNQAEAAERTELRTVLQQVVAARLDTEMTNTNFAKAV